MIYLPAIVSVTCYFEKYRSLATGIAVCGSGLGTFIFAPLVDFLVTGYGWRATVGVIAGLVLLCTLFGMLFRPLTIDEQQQPTQTIVENNGTSTVVVLNIVEPPAECEPLNGSCVVAGSHSYDQIPNEGGGGGGCKDEEEDWQRRQRIERKVSHNLLLSQEVNTNTFGNDKQSRFTLSQPELIVASSDSNGRLNTRQKNEMCYASQSLKPLPANGGGIMYQKDIFYSGSLKNISVNRRRYVPETSDCLSPSTPLLPSHHRSKKKKFPTMTK